MAAAMITAMAMTGKALCELLETVFEEGGDEACISPSRPGGKVVL